MAAIVAPGICRYSINGTLDGQPVVNVLDLNISDVVNGSREDAVATACGDIINQWADHVLPLVTDEYRFDSVSWVDLDSIDGSTGERSSTDGTTLPQNGGDAGACMPGGVALLVRKIGSGGRRERNGRWYIAGISEGVTALGTVNTVNSGYVALANTAFESVRSGLEGAEGPGINGVSYTSSPNIVHTVDGVYVGKSRITTLSVDDRLATQRRRQR